MKKITYKTALVVAAFGLLCCKGYFNYQSYPKTVRTISDLPDWDEIGITCRCDKETRGNKRSTKELLESPSHRYSLDGFKAHVDKSHYTHLKGKTWTSTKKS